MHPPLFLYRHVHHVTPTRRQVKNLLRSILLFVGVEIILASIDDMMKGSSYPSSKEAYGASNR